MASKGQVIITPPNLHSVESKARFLLADNLKQLDSLGDPTHVTPIFRFPLERLLRHHGFSVFVTWGHLEDASSPNSRLILRLLAWLARLLGAKDAPAGDTICMLVGRSTEHVHATDEQKRCDLTARY